jgi:hypothetical protein
MREFYHYTLEKNISSIMATGIFPNHPYFTTTEYFSAFTAGQALGIMAHYIDCVLKFQDDGLFKVCENVPDGRFSGGGNQYQHSMRPKPIAVRKITERIWKSLI